MKLEATELRLVPASEGVYCSFYVRKPGELESTVKSLAGKAVWVEINRMEPVRSLSANSYFHVLAQKIASAQGTSMDEIKKHLVLQYGTIARNDDGSVIYAIIPSGTNPDSYYPYMKWTGTSPFYSKKARKEIPMDTYLFMKQTHTLTSSEMSKLIDGTVSECKELGIETLPPEDLKAILGRWGNDR